MGVHKDTVAQGQSAHRWQNWGGLQQVLGAVCLPAARGLADHSHRGSHRGAKQVSKGQTGPQ